MDPTSNHHPIRRPLEVLTPFPLVGGLTQLHFPNGNRRIAVAGFPAAIMGSKYFSFRVRAEAWAALRRAMVVGDRASGFRRGEKEVETNLMPRGAFLAWLICFSHLDRWQTKLTRRLISIHSDGP